MNKSQKILIAVGFASLAVAQNPVVTPNGIVNVASFALAGQPNGAIAPGSVVVIFGSNMGPAILQQAGAYPLPITLGGTSVKVTSGTTTTDAIMIYTWATSPSSDIRRQALVPVQSVPRLSARPRPVMVSSPFLRLRY